MAGCQLRIQILIGLAGSSAKAVDQGFMIGLPTQLLRRQLGCHVALELRDTHRAPAAVSIRTLRGQGVDGATRDKLLASDTEAGVRAGCLKSNSGSARVGREASQGQMQDTAFQVCIGMRRQLARLVVRMRHIP